MAGAVVAATSLWVWPYGVGYLNQLAGGPQAAPDLVSDSNLDWGQDLGQLKQWTEAHPGSEPLKLCYFGTADPRYYGLRHRNLLGG